MFNIFNTPNFNPPSGNSLTTSTAFLPSTPGGAFPTQAGRVQGPGAITSVTAPMRQIQFGLKFLF
jgi:hypothetical protein